MLSGSKHTPGPWTVDERDAGLSILAGDLLIVDLVSGVTDDEVDANASLIAAGPDLLEARYIKSPLSTRTPMILILKSGGAPVAQPSSGLQRQSQKPSDETRRASAEASKQGVSTHHQRAHRGRVSSIGARCTKCWPAYGPLGAEGTCVSATAVARRVQAARGEGLVQAS